MGWHQPNAPVVQPVMGNGNIKGIPNLPGLKLMVPILQRPQHFNQGYLPNGAAPGHINPLPGAAPLLPNNGRVIQTGGVRVLCVADVRGTASIAS